MTPLSLGVVISSGGAKVLNQGGQIAPPHYSAATGY